MQTRRNHHWFLRIVPSSCCHVKWLVIQQSTVKNDRQTWIFDAFPNNRNTIWEASYLVQASADINGAVLDDIVHHLRDGHGEIRVGELRMEKNLGSQEAFIAHIHTEELFVDSIAPLIFLKPFAWVWIILGKLFGYIRTHIAEPLLESGTHTRIIHNSMLTVQTCNCLYTFRYVKLVCITVFRHVNWVNQKKEDIAW